MNGQIPLLPREGEQVGAGVILGLINTGGSAAVFETWVETLELRRAVKVAHPDSNTETRERMLTEARILSKLVHPNIVHVYNYGETAGGLPYLEMDFVNGVMLEDLIEKHGALPLPAAFAIAAAALEALHYAHTISYTLNKTQLSGVVHRDIKPENVMIITTNGSVKLMDFGIAQPIGISMHTEDGTAPGTLRYMSPEAYANGNCDARSDLYQIGLLLYECIRGRAAFPQAGRMELNDAKAENAYEPLPAGVDSRAAAIIEKCMRFDPDERYQTAQECLADVRAICSALCPRAAPEQVIKSFIDGMPLPRIKPKRNYMKTLRPVAQAASIVLIGTAATAAAIHYSPRLIPLAAKVYAAVKAAAPAPNENAAAPALETQAAAPTPQEQNAETEPVYSGANQNPRPRQPRKAAPPTQEQIAAAEPVYPDTSQPVSQNPQPQETGTAEADDNDPALTLINQADILLADKEYSGALAAYQMAIETPTTAARQDIIKKSLYGSARCNTALFQAGKTTRSNYIVAWRSVANAYPTHSRQRVEALARLSEETAN